MKHGPEMITEVNNCLKSGFSAKPRDNVGNGRKQGKLLKYIINSSLCENIFFKFLSLEILASKHFE